jgi:ribosomal-protein-alanine N-acetyltransferase
LTGRPVFLDRAAKADVPALVSLERASFTAAWTEADLAGAVDAARGSETLVLRAPGSGAPRSEIVGCCSWQLVIDEMHVHNVAIAPAERGRGLARALVRAALRAAARRGARVAFLEVRPSNVAAVRLYAALGFTHLSVRRDYYAHPREDALVLRKVGLP